MKHISRFALLALLAMGLVGLVSTATALAQSTTPAPTPAAEPPTPAPTASDARMDRLRTAARWDHFLDNHPEVEKRLNENPSLLNNPAFLKNHPALQEYLKRHPEFAKAASEHPEGAMRLARRFDRREGRLHRQERRHRMNH